MNPGGGGCSEPRSRHCTPAWATTVKLCLKKKKKKKKKENRTLRLMSGLDVSLKTLGASHCPPNELQSSKLDTHGTSVIFSSVMPQAACDPSPQIQACLPASTWTFPWAVSGTWKSHNANSLYLSPLEFEPLHKLSRHPCSNPPFCTFHKTPLVVCLGLYLCTGLSPLPENTWGTGDYVFSFSF